MRTQFLPFLSGLSRLGTRHTGLFIGILISALMALPGQVQAQIDSVFWFAAPNLFQGHGDRPILLRMASFEEGATVTISQPANPGFKPISTYVGPNSAKAVDLTAWVNDIENAPGNTINKKGLLIRSTALVSVYYDIANAYNGDMFSLKGKNGLGTAFHVPFQNAWANRYPISTIELVATENFTEVIINPTQDMVGHKAGIPFKVVLMRGETFSCEAASPQGNKHLSGTFISSNKPIAVTTRDESINPGVGGCMDTAGDQLIPDKKAGQDFIILKGFLAAPDNFYVLATQNGTSVVVDGVEVATLDAGQSYRHILSTTTAYVRTSKPVHVFHLTGFGCEVGGAVIPTLTCTGSKAVSITRATSQFLSLNIVAPTAIIGSFTFNGRTDVITAAKFAPVPGTGGAWSYARLELNTTVFPVGVAALIRNSAGKFQLGFIHGDLSSTCRYAYFSAFAEGDLDLSVSEAPYCQGAPVVMQAKSTAASQFMWRGPNGFTATGSTVRLDNAQPKQSGYYVVTTVGAECTEKTDSVYINIKGFSIQRSSVTMCSGTRHELPSGRMVTAGGEYRDTLRYATGCDSLIRVYTVFVKPSPVLTLAKSNDVNCEIGLVKLSVKGAGTYRWWPQETLDNPVSSSPVARPEGPTWYRVKGTASNGCTATDSIRVDIVKEYNESAGHSIPTAFSPNGDGRNDCFGVRHWGWVKDFSLVVYSRWGDLVFQTNDIQKCWDGTVNGRMQASEVFVYVIRGTTNCGPVYRKGTVALIR